MQDSPEPRTREAVDWWLNQWRLDDVASGNEPLSRENIKNLICVNGGHGAGLDLSFRNLNAADLSECNLREACLRGADLGHTDLRDADLFRADLREADLFRADLRGAFMREAQMDRNFLAGVRIDEQTDLADISWGHKHINEWERIGFYENARAVYRQLFTWHKNRGYSDVAGEFLYRDWVCKRLGARSVLTEGLSWHSPWRIPGLFKLLWWKALVSFLFLIMFELLFGYGERPFRVSFFAAFVVLVFAMIFFLLSPLGTPCNQRRRTFLSLMALLLFLPGFLYNSGLWRVGRAPGLVDSQPGQHRILYWPVHHRHVPGDFYSQMDQVAAKAGGRRNHDVSAHYGHGA